MKNLLYSHSYWNRETRGSETSAHLSSLANR